MVKQQYKGFEYEIQDNGSFFTVTYANGAELLTYKTFETFEKAVKGAKLAVTRREQKHGLGEVK